MYKKINKEICLTQLLNIKKTHISAFQTSIGGSTSQTVFPFMQREEEKYNNLRQE
jgi:hypothetical protein